MFNCLGEMLRKIYGFGILIVLICPVVHTDEDEYNYNENAVSFRRKTCIFDFYCNIETEYCFGGRGWVNIKKEQVERK